MKTNKESNALALQPMENLQSALNLSVTTNAELKKRGEEILNSVNLSTKSDVKEVAVELSEFVQECKDEVVRMRSLRKPYTTGYWRCRKNLRRWRVRSIRLNRARLLMLAKAVCVNCSVRNGNGTNR